MVAVYVRFRPQLAIELGLLSSALGLGDLGGDFLLLRRRGGFGRKSLTENMVRPTIVEVAALCRLEVVHESLQFKA